MNESTFSKFPCLETGRLVLREIKPIDTAALFGLYSQDQIMRYRGADIFRSTSEALQLIQQFKKRFTLREGIRWGLALKGKEENLLGTAGLKNIQWQHFRAEIGYELSPEFWNQGLMTEALHCITAYSLSEQSLRTLEANISPDNHASARVLDKLGFVKEAHYRENYYYKGWWDSAIYTLHKVQAA
jgi:ribosomal-protein-alanine N-acetyltransferase